MSGHPLAARRALVLLAIAVIGVVTSACSDGNDSSSPSTTTRPGASTGLTGVNWVLTDQASLGVPLTGVTVTARFENGSISGDTGCNAYGGSYSTTGSSMTIGDDIVTTQRACLPAGSGTSSPSAVERAYLGKLPDVGSFRVSHDTLTLAGRNDKALLVYRASDGARDLAGNWIVTGYYTGDAIQSVITSTNLTARFDHGVVSGEAGCNLYNGPFEIQGEQITIGPLASTLAACADPAAQTQESQYLAALALATAFRVTGDRLDLFRPGGTFAATFVRPTK